MPALTKLNKATLMIADSNKDRLIITQTYFESSGYKVLTATTCINALKNIYSHNPDIIIMDSSLPDISGYESFRLIKSDPEIRDIPIILLCAKNNGANMLDFEFGTDNFTVEEFDLDNISSLVSKIIGKKNRYGLNRQIKPEISDTDLLTKISKILDRKLKETSLIASISQYANNSMDYYETISNIFYVCRPIFHYTFMAVHIAEENEILIDTLKPLGDDYVNWVIYKAHQECGYDYKTVRKKTLIERGRRDETVIWDSDGYISVKKIFSRSTHIGSIIVANAEPLNFEHSSDEILASISAPFATILDNIRLQCQTSKTNEELKLIHEELIECSHNIESKIEDRTMKLHKLYEAGKILTTIHEPNRLLATLVDMIINSIGAEVGAALLYDNGKISKKIEFGLEFNVIKDLRYRDKLQTPVYKKVLSTGEMVVLNKSQISKYLDMKIIKSRNLHINSLACLPFKTGTNVIGIMLVINKLRNDTFTKDDIDSLSTLSSMATVAIENATLYQQTILKTKLEADVRMAMEMQVELLPKGPPNSDVFEVSSMYTPAEMIGGDYYDYIYIEDGKIGFVVADVTGHGVPAAFIMTQVKACVQLSARGISSTQQVVRSINSFLYKNIPKNNFVSMLYTIIDERERTLLYTSAGHNPSLWFSSKTGKFKSISTEGLFLSLFENTDYGEVKIPFEKGDIFLFYTDGLTEAVNEKKEFFGTDRLKEIIKKNKSRSAQDITSCIFWSLQDFIGRSALNDDMTFIVLKIKK